MQNQGYIQPLEVFPKNHWIFVGTGVPKITLTKPPLITHHSSLISHQPSLVSHHPSLINYHPATITHYPFPIAHHSSSITHNSELITYHLSPITHSFLCFYVLGWVKISMGSAKIKELLAELTNKHCNNRIRQRSIIETCELWDILSGEETWPDPKGRQWQRH